MSWDHNITLGRIQFCNPLTALIQTDYNPNLYPAISPKGIVILHCSMLRQITWGTGTNL
jgi:hypothetical protein